MEPSSYTINDCAVNSQYDQAIVKQENINVIDVNGVIEREYIEEIDHNNESPLLETDNGIPSCAIPKKQNVDCDIVRKNKRVISLDTVTDLSDDEDAEQWRARKNKKIGYFKQGNLMANMKKLKPFQTINEKTETVVDLTTISGEENQITENNMVTPRAVKTVETFTTPGSYCSPIDKTQLKNDTYPNRLKKDVNFYRKMVRNNDTKDEKSYIVGIYKHVKNTTGYTDILFSDFDTLSDYRLDDLNKMCLNYFVISIILASYSVKYSQKSNTQIFRANLVDSIIENQNYNGKVSIKENSFLTIPWNVGETHWIIAFVDFFKKECYILDPMGHPIDVEEVD